MIFCLFWFNRGAKRWASEVASDGTRIEKIKSACLIISSSVLTSIILAELDNFWVRSLRPVKFVIIRNWFWPEESRAWPIEWPYRKWKLVKNCKYLLPYHQDSL
jgi:hypothetical protein